MKYALLISGVFAIAPSVSFADTFLGVYAGAQVWQVETEGNFFDSSQAAAEVQNFNFDDKTQGAFYIAFEHFIPFVPNIKVNHTQLEPTGSAELTSQFEFGGETFSVNTTIDTEADIASTDIILYYELFDNDLFSIDLGLNGKYIDGDLAVFEQTTSSRSEESFKGIVPMLYSRVEFNLPFSGLGIYAEGSYLSFDENSVSDFQAALTYDAIDSVAFDFTLQAGYRDISIELDDVDDISSDLQFSGFFAGIEIHF